MMQKLLKILKAGAVGVITGLIVAYAYDLYNQHHVPSLSFLVMGILFVAFLPVAVFLHELGHLLAGVACGMRPVTMVVGPYSLMFERGRPKSIQKHQLIFGGFTYCAPKKSGAAALGLMVAGGPIMSLLLVVSAFGLALYRGGVLGDFAFVFALVNACAFFLTIYPQEKDGLASDGARLWSLLRRGEKGRQFVAAYRRSGLLFDNKTPANWDLEGLDFKDARANSASKSSERATALLTILWRDLDAGKYEKALACLSQVEDAIPSGLPDTLTSGYYMELAVLAALLCDDIQQAISWHAEVVPAPMIEPYMEDLYKGLIAARQGDQDARDAALDRARGQMSAALMRSIANMYQQIIDIIPQRSLPLRSDDISP